MEVARASVGDRAHEVGERLRRELGAREKALGARAVFASPDYVVLAKDRGARDSLALVPGDHLSWRGADPMHLFEHHCVCVGGGLTVGLHAVDSADVVRRALLLRFDARPGIVKVTDLRDVAGTHKITRVGSARGWKERRRAVWEALSAVGSRDYDLLRDNCEHFARSLLYGHPRCFQLSRMPSSVLLPFALRALGTRPGMGAAAALAIAAIYFALLRKKKPKAGENSSAA